jgi:hypothetical protein
VTGGVESSEIMLATELERDRTGFVCPLQATVVWPWDQYDGEATKEMKEVRDRIIYAQYEEGRAGSVVRSTRLRVRGGSSAENMTVGDKR